MTTYITNAFSLNMVSAAQGFIEFKEISVAQAQRASAAAVWGVGHADTSEVFCDVLGIDSRPAARITITLQEGDTVVVGQYRGPRLPEGATSLPPGATIQWVALSVSTTHPTP